MISLSSSRRFGAKVIGYWAEAQRFPGINLFNFTFELKLRDNFVAGVDGIEDTEG